jgi:hypothetical protein
MDVVHPLKLDPGRSGREVTSYEGYFDVELDRSSVFLAGEQGIEYDEVPKMAELEGLEIGTGSQDGRQMSSPLMDRNDVEDPDTIRVADLRDLPGGKSTGKLILPKSESVSDDVERASDLDDAEIRQIVDLLEPYSSQLHEVVKKYPLIDSEAESGNLPYTVAPSARTFLSWNVGRQKSIEWHRGRLIHNDVVAELPAESASAITVKSIIVWCRQTQLGPPAYSDLDDESLQYCRYCGMIEDLPPPKGQKRSRSSYGVDAYCRCSQGTLERLSLMKTASSVQDMIEHNPVELLNTSNNTPDSLSSSELRALLSRTDINLMRWVWRTILQLRLPSTNPISEEDDESEEEPLAVSAILTHATKSFLTQLIHLASPQNSAEQEDDDEVIIVGVTSKTFDQQNTTAPLVITPIHILRAIRARREFDFLTNAGMATGSPQGGGAVG